MASGDQRARAGRRTATGSVALCLALSAGCGTGADGPSAAAAKEDLTQWTSALRSAALADEDPVAQWTVDGDGVRSSREGCAVDERRATYSATVTFPADGSFTAYTRGTYLAGQAREADWSLKGTVDSDSDSGSGSLSLVRSGSNPTGATVQVSYRKEAAGWVQSYRARTDCLASS